MKGRGGREKGIEKGGVVDEERGGGREGTRREGEGKKERCLCVY